MSRGPDPGLVRGRLLAWFDRSKRPLPWRADRDPYRVLVSEVMLQQTRVETVIPYYSRWLEQFPDVDALAAAEVDAVLLAWRGLGYYRRARNLHLAARIVVDEHGGRLPGSGALLRELPGVGEYTAGAVASIAFGEVAPAVDGNVKRVLSRLYDLPPPTPRILREHALGLIDRERPGDFNEALMELGATVCTPRGPRCDACPLEADCLARERGTVALRPATSKRRPVPEVDVDVAVVIDGEGRALLVRRPPDGLLGGLWEFPSAETVGELGLEVRAVASLSPVRHAFSHLRATYRPRVHSLLGRRGEGTGDGGRWVSVLGLDALALPVAQQKIGALAREWLVARD